MRALITTAVLALVLAGPAAAGDGSPGASGPRRGTKPRLDPAAAVVAAALAEKRSELHGQLLRDTRSQAPAFAAPEPLVARQPARPSGEALPLVPATRVAQH